MTAKFQSFNWMRGVSDDKAISVIHRFVLVRLCLYRRDNRPGYDKIAEWLGVDRSTVFRAVDAGIRRGWLAPRAGHGGYVKHQFEFTFPITQQSQLCDGSRAPNRRRKPSQRNLQAVDFADEAATLRNKKDPSGECYAFPLKAGERERASRDEDSSSSAGAPPLTRDPAEDFDSMARPSPRREKKGNSSEERIAAEIPNGSAFADSPSENCNENNKDGPAFAESVPVAGQLSATTDNYFRELRDLWQRGWAADDTPKAQAIARQAFERACRNGANPAETSAEIIDGARTWVAAADAPRFLPALPQWLAAKGWQQAPPAKRQHRHAGGRGGGRRERAPRSNGKPDFAQIGAELARQYEAHETGGAAS